MVFIHSYVYLKIHKNSPKFMPKNNHKVFGYIIETKENMGKTDSWTSVFLHIKLHNLKFSKKEIRCVFIDSKSFREM